VRTIDSRTRPKRDEGDPGDRRWDCIGKGKASLKKRVIRSILRITELEMEVRTAGTTLTGIGNDFTTFHGEFTRFRVEIDRITILLLLGLLDSGSDRWGELREVGVDNDRSVGEFQIDRLAVPPGGCAQSPYFTITDCSHRETDLSPGLYIKTGVEVTETILAEGGGHRPVSIERPDVIGSGNCTKAYHF
jgi:hypothetical protein